MPAAASGAPTLGVELLLHRRSDRGRARSPPSSTASTASARRSSRRRWREAEAEAHGRARRSRRRARWSSPPREGWHPGVVGLVAARLKERFGRPAFAIALEPGGIGTGSGRSIAGVDLGRAVRHAVERGLLLKGGGHAMAAGVTLRKDALARVPRLSRGRARRGRRGGAARRCAADRRRGHRRRRQRRHWWRPSRARARSAPAIPSR